MAQDAVDAAAAAAAPPARAAPRDLPLVGAASREALRRVDAPARLVRRYGTEAPAVLALAGGDPSCSRRSPPASTCCGVELLHAVRHELALEPSDLLDRRTRIGSSRRGAPPCSTPPPHRRAAFHSLTRRPGSALHASQRSASALRWVCRLSVPGHGGSVPRHIPTLVALTAAVFAPSAPTSPARRPEPCKAPASGFQSCLRVLYRPPTTAAADDVASPRRSCAAWTHARRSPASARCPSPQRGT